MFIGPEKLVEIFGKGSRTGLAINSTVNRCVGCPFAGMCTPCKPQAIKTEASIIKSSPIFESGIKKLTDSVITSGSIPFRPVGETLRPVSSEKTCSQCGKNPITCPHSERN